MPSILTIIKERRSIRQYQDKEISAEIVGKIKQALIWAPSAGNLQARKFYFVFSPAVKERLGRAYDYQPEFISRAPLVIVACADEKKMARYGERGRSVYLITDIAASLQNATLVAQEQGLGSCWIGAFDEAAVAKILKLPNHLRPVIMLPVGYPNEKPAARPRVSAEEAVEEVK